MTFHEESSVWILDYLEGALAPEDQRLLEEHVEACPECRRELEQARALEDLLEREVRPEEPLPAGFSARLFARLDRLEAGEEALEEVPGELQPPHLPMNGKVAEVVGPARGSGTLTVRSLPFRGRGRLVRPGRTFLAAAAAVLMMLGLNVLAMATLRPEAPSPLVARAPRVKIVPAGTLAPAVAAKPSETPVVVSETLALDPGATVVTAPGDEAGVLVAGTGNELRVAPDSEVVVGPVERDLSQRRLVAEVALTRGSLLVTEQNARMIVQTPHLTVIPLGTEYEATLDGDRTDVAVYEGSVKVLGADGSEKVVQAGEEISAGAGAPLARAVPGRLDEQRLQEARQRWKVPLAAERRRAAGREAALPDPLVQRLRQQRQQEARPAWMPERPRQGHLQHPGASGSAQGQAWRQHARERARQWRQRSEGSAPARRAWPPGDRSAGAAEGGVGPRRGQPPAGQHPSPAEPARGDAPKGDVGPARTEGDRTPGGWHPGRPGPGGRLPTASERRRAAREALRRAGQGGRPSPGVEGPGKSPQGLPEALRRRLEEKQRRLPHPGYPRVQGHRPSTGEVGSEREKLRREGLQRTRPGSAPKWSRPADPSSSTTPHPPRPGPTRTPLPKGPTPGPR